MSIVRTAAPSSQGSLARNVISNWVLIAANVAYAFFITPIVVRGLRTEAYGVWSFLNGLLGYSDLLYLGLGSALIKNVAQSRAKGDSAAVNRLLSVVLSIYSFLGLLCLVALAVVSLFVGDLLANPLDPSAAGTASQVCLLLGVRLLFAFVTSAFSGFICGHDRFDLVNRIGLVFVVLRAASIPLAVRGQNPLLALAAVICCLGAVETVAYAVQVRLLSPTARVRVVLPDRTELRLLYGFGFQSFVLLMSFKLISYTDTTVIGIVLGATPVALYALQLQLIEYGRLAVSGFSGVLLPRLTAIASGDDRAQLRDAYIRDTRIGMFLAALFLANLVSLGARFLGLWVGQTFEESARLVLPVLGAATLCQMVAYYVPFSYYQATHRLAKPSKVLFAEAALNLVLSIVLAKRLGILGVALGTLIPAACLSTSILPYYLCRQFGVPLRRYAREALLPALAMLCAGLVTLAAFNHALPSDSYWTLISKASITGILAAAIVLLTFPKRDRRSVLKLFGLACE